MKYKKAIVALSATVLLLAVGAGAAFAAQVTSGEANRALLLIDTEKRQKMLDARGVRWFPDGSVEIQGTLYLPDGSVAYWSGDLFEELEERGIRLLPDGSFEEIKPDHSASPAAD